MTISHKARGWLIELGFFILMGAAFGGIVAALDLEVGFWTFLVFFVVLGLIYEGGKYVVKTRKGLKTPDE